MNSNAIRHAIMDKGLTVKQLAAQLGYKSGPVLSTILSRGCYSADQLTAIIDALDCDLLIRDRSSGREYIIEYEPKRRKQTEQAQPAQEDDDVLGPDFWEL